VGCGRQVRGGISGKDFFSLFVRYVLRLRAFVLESSKARGKEVHTRPELSSLVQKLSKKTAIAQEKVM
jgi:hypothetical protein